MLRRFGAASALFLLLAGLAYYFMVQRGLHAPLPAQAEGYTYTVKKGASFNRVAKDLREAGLLSGSAYFSWKVHARLHGLTGRLKAGEYQLQAGLSAKDLLDMLVQGDTISHPLTLVEGWNFAQIIAAVAAHPKLEHTLTDLSPAAVMERLGYPDVHPEGRFYPDTYHFDSNMTDVAILQRAYRKMQNELASAWAERAPDIPLDTPEEALILASIVEKETGVPDERPLIAAVFTRRLHIGMPLQTDPTVIYGLGESFDGNLRRTHLRRDTPYNTYTRKGLPPTPIAMPGRDALRAAVKPADAKKLYFVATGDGGHYFSESLAEHDCAVIRYQLKDKSPSRYRQWCRKRPRCDACS